MCPERRGLLKIITNLSHAYVDETTYLGCIAGGNDREAFQRALKRARELRIALREVRNKYELHIAHHGCKARTDGAIKSDADSFSQSSSAQSRSGLNSK